MNKSVFIVDDDYLVENMFRLRGFALTDDPRTAAVLCFTGGADVSPLLYGEEPLPQTYCNPRRDTAEIRTLRMTDDLRGEGAQIAVGICRGGQFLNVMAGGGMWQDVNKHGGSHDAYDMLGDRVLRVTSTHHQMMRPSFAARLLMTAAESTEKHRDGISWRAKAVPAYEDIEAIWYDDQKFLCFQPHPEYGGAPTCTDVFFEYVNWFQPKFGWATKEKVA